jgi:hypothetical protein
MRKSILTTLALIMVFVTGFAQDKSQCGNCNEKYLKTRTFGGTNVISLNKTYYVFYKLYTPNDRTCMSQNQASTDVIEAFSDALKENKEYQQLLIDYKDKNGSNANGKNQLVGRAIHYTDDHNEILDPFKSNATRFHYDIRYIELDIDLKSKFDKYIICD